jgi:hypothetical protein
MKEAKGYSIGGNTTKPEKGCWLTLRTCEFGEDRTPETDLATIHLEPNNIEHLIKVLLLYLPKTDTVKENGIAMWEYWSGWSGNHDRRIEDATCSNCEFVHKTVYGSPDELASECPSCKRKMIKY